MKTPLLLLLAISCGVAAARSGAATTTPKPARKAAPPTAGVIVEREPPPLWSAAWFADSIFVKRTVVAMADTITAVRAGAMYPQGRAGRACDEFHGQSYSFTPEEYWLFRCAGSELGGRREDLYYQVSADSAPTLERVRWFVSAPSGTTPSQWREFRSRLADRLARSWGPSNDSGSSGPLHGSASTLTIRLNGTATTIDSLEIELRTDRLDAAFALQDWKANEADLWNPDPYRAERLGAQVSALRDRWPALASAVSADSAKPSDLSAMIAALRQGRNATGDDRDLLLFTTHTWLAWYASSIGERDSTRALALRKAVREFGGTVGLTPDGVWCYGSTALNQVASKAGQDRWADEAFLLRMSEGWEAPCSLCGTDSTFGSDEWKEVIRRGGAFLATYPESPIAPRVRLLLAEAHETAWSLSKTGNINEDYIDPMPYRLDAPAHRSEAIRLYERFLSERPDDPQAMSIRRRLGRMRLDVDTSYHRFWCVWD